MKIVAIEGLDKSGKATQTKLLREALEQQGHKVATSEFHRYDTPTGKLVMDWLTGKYDVDQLTIEFIMAADKQAQQGWFRELDAMGYDILILDRYTLSQQAYAKANKVPASLVNELQRHMIAPDINIIIDIPANISMTRKGKHNDGQNDRYESDLAMLMRVREYYLNSWNCFILDGEMSIEHIHEKMYRFTTALMEGRLASYEDHWCRLRFNA
ncbi:dTMP kinase [Paenibacillus sp. UNC496MF]|uniref:dTMP kinase n=1 Tax=Paenibacillus sp. UNC496MF TaxID=1502753 RepID=UPI000B89C8C3|nr:dTMP kinase [Paenibacillus sp. UNC496MF]